MSHTTAVRPHLPTVLALSGAAALTLGAMTAAPAWAHDTLIASTPEADEVVEESPEEIILEFSGDGLTTGENIPNTIWVTDDDGEHWEGETEVEGATMSTELTEPLPNGEYEVLYHVVYSDGHNEELGFSFEVDAAVQEEEDDDAAAADEDDAAAEETEAAEGTEEAQETEEATDPDEDEGAAEDDGAQELNGEDTAADQEDQFPVWTAVAFGAGILVLIILGVVLVRRKLKQDA